MPNDFDVNQKPEIIFHQVENDYRLSRAITSTNERINAPNQKSRIDDDAKHTIVDSFFSFLSEKH